ncbi:MAG: hypothetical protein LBV17_06250 [Treponema sp.]|jgi:hypothetical protein|nr:hypothetical protein [Treponema sp.]
MPSFCFFNCTTDKVLKIKKKSGEKNRFFEKSGGYSIIPPEKWQVAEVPGYKYKALVGQKENDAVPSIGFAVEMFKGRLKEFVDLIIKKIKNVLGETFLLLQRDSFVTSKNIKGERIIINITLGQRLRQCYYFFPGKKNKIIQIVCTVPASSGNLYDEMFYNSMKTLEIK